MHIALLRALLSIPDAHSLKDKRQVLKSVKDRSLKRMNVSVAEVGLQEVWNRAELAFITVAAEQSVTDKRLAAILQLLESGGDWVLLEVKTERL